MKKLYYLLPFVFLAFLLFSCSPSSEPLSFTGTWEGTWEDLNCITNKSLQSGTLSLNIDSAGNIQGSIYNSDINATALISGTILNNGLMNLTYTFDIMYNARGYARIENNHFLVNPNSYENSSWISVSAYDLTKIN